MHYILFMWSRTSASANNALDAASQNELRQPHKRKSASQKLSVWWCCSRDVESCWIIIALSWFGCCMAPSQQRCAQRRHRPTLTQPLCLCTASSRPAASTSVRACLYPSSHRLGSTPALSSSPPFPSLTTC